jgi:hypothetical protein
MDLTLIVYLKTKTQSDLCLPEFIFLDSLRSHKVNKKTEEIKFESDITLNASHVLLEDITWDSKKIFFYSSKKTEYFSWCVTYGGFQHALQRVKPENFPGMGLLARV